MARVESWEVEPWEIVGLPCAPEAVPPIHAIRGTMVLSSVQAMRARGLTDAYFERLPAAHHDGIRSVLAALWVPLALADAHYTVMDQLIADPEVQLAIGEEVGRRLERTFIARVARSLGRATGADLVMMMLPQLPRVLGRIAQGGAARAVGLGRKDARIEFYGVTLARFSYVRMAWQGLIHSGLGAVTSRVYARELPPPAGPHSLAFDVSWV